MTLLKKIISLPDYYARFLNTLSMLEYTGARKIVKSQKKIALSESMLAHLYEEIRHALILKHAALKIKPEYSDYSEKSLLCGLEANHYFQVVDHAANQVLGETDIWHCYLYTTWLVETRAIRFYSQCQDVLLEAGLHNIFRSILAEEHKHLQEVHEELKKIPDYNTKLATLMAIEEQEFEIFLSAMENMMGQVILLPATEEMV